MLLVTPPRMYMNLVRFLICSATRVAPWVRTWDTRWVAVVVAGFCLLERFRVWENAVEGAKRIKVSKVIVIGFKMCVSPLLLFSDRMTL